MPEPGLYPTSAPRLTDSHAERRVYEALRTALPTGWYAWHSLRIRTKDGWFGEGDFVLAAPRRGLVVLEVKGGQVELRDGHWLQNGRAMDPPPLDQAHRFRRLVLDRLTETGCRPPAHGVLLCFGDTAFDSPPSQDDLRELTLGAHDLPWLREVLLVKLDKALPSPGGRQSGNWVARLHELWGETWKPRLALGHRVKAGAEARIRLEGEQLEVLDQIDANERILVEGPAGSGKTLIAREAALRFAQEGKRVLLLTFTEALALWLRHSVDSPGADVEPIRRLSLALLREAELADEPATGSPEWEDMSLRAAELPDLESRYDAVVIDEAQDLNTGDWLLVERLAGRGRLWAFHDPAQRYWTERQIPLELFPARFTLRRPQRCHPAIQALADRYAGRDPVAPMVETKAADGVVGVVACAGDAVLREVAAEIDRLRAAGLAPNDIAVLSLRGRAAEKSIVHHDRIGSHRVVPADSPAMTEHVVCDTFLRFKGLERPAIIVTDVGGVAPAQRGVRMHIALTRALDLVRVVGEQTAIDEDPLLHVIGI